MAQNNTPAFIDRLLIMLTGCGLAAMSAVPIGLWTLHPEAGIAGGCLLVALAYLALKIAAGIVTGTLERHATQAGWRYLSPTAVNVSGARRAIAPLAVLAILCVGALCLQIIAGLDEPLERAWALGAGGAGATVLGIVAIVLRPR